MPEPTPVPIDTSWLNEHLASAVTEAWDLAMECRSPDVGAGLQSLHDTLVRTRQAQERVEEIMAGVNMLLARVKDAEVDREADLDDAWNAQATRPRRGFSNDTAPRERYAGYATATVKEQVEARRAAKTTRRVAAAAESVRQAHRRLEGTRWTTDARIRAQTIDTRLER